MVWLLKRWWFWAGTGFMLVAVCAGYLLIPVREGRISQAACERIQLGMTIAEVEELLGEKKPLDERFPVKGIDWMDDDGNLIDVEFDGRVVTGKTFFDIPLTERMKRRIERRIRAIWP